TLRGQFGWRYGERNRCPEFVQDIGECSPANAREPGIEFHRARYVAIGVDGEQWTNAAIAKRIRPVHAVRRQMLTKGEGEEMLCLEILHRCDGSAEQRQMQELPGIKELAVARETVQERSLIGTAFDRKRSHRGKGPLRGL